MVIPGDEPPQIQGSPHLDRLEEYGDVTLYTDRPADDAEKLERVKGADIIINSRSTITWPEGALRSLPDLQLIATCSIGTDNIDLETAAEMGVIVSNQPGATAPIVAEHAFALMCAAAKRVGFHTTALKNGDWVKAENIYLQGKTLGVIGAGNIGADMIRLGNVLGMDVISWTFHPSEDRADRLGTEFVSLDRLLGESDVVSLHVSLTDETEHLIGPAELRSMKEGALLVNTGRGDLVDTDALVTALRSGHLAGAALDVFDQEPLPDDHPILECDQVVLTPHAADQTPEGIDRLNEGVVENVIAYIEGDPRNVVTPFPNEGRGE